MKRGTLLAVLGTGLVIAALVALPRVTEEPMTVRAHFEDTVGLYVGNGVSILGMPVGTVTGIEPKSTYIEVTMKIDEDVDIPADVQAVTVSTSILTDRHIELTPAYQGGPKLRDGDQLGLGRTRTPVEFDRTLAMVDKLAAALSGDGRGGGPVADLISTGDQLATTSGSELKTTLSALSDALRLGADNGAESKRDIQAIATSLADLTQSAADNDVAIREFGSQIRQLSDILHDESLGSGSTGANLNELLSRATTLLEDNRESLKSTATGTTVLTQALVDYQRELAEFFDVAPLAIDNVYNAVNVDTGTIRVHALVDKILFDSQFGKEVCNLINKQQLGCATGTPRDYGPDFGLIGMLELMAGVRE